MDGTILLEGIRLMNVLSFGANRQDIELEPLNVLIGPNGSGKSNVIEIIDLLRAAPKSIADAARTLGSIEDWLWKGSIDGKKMNVNCWRDTFR